MVCSERASERINGKGLYMKKVKYFALLVAFLSLSVQAKEAPFGKNDAQFLVESCREVVEIFKKRDQTSFLAAQRTSLSEGMRAGYCIGVLQQYSKTANYCSYSRSNWFQMAKVIAGISIPEAKLARVSTDRLLKEAYCER